MKVYLRAFELEDSISIHKWNMDGNITESTAANRSYYSSERVKEWVRGKIASNLSEHYLAVCLCQNDQMIGYVSLRNIENVNRNAFWGGVLIGEYKYRNIVNTVQAIFLLLDFGFFELGMHKIYGKWMSDNKPSLLLGDIFGFRQDGILRDEVFKRGRFHDIVVKSLLKEEYDKRRAALMRDYNISMPTQDFKGCIHDN